MLYTPSPANSIDRFISDFYLSQTEYLLGDVRSLFLRQFLKTQVPECEQKEAEGCALICSYLGAVPITVVTSHPDFLHHLC